MTFFVKDDKIIRVYRYGWKAFGQNENLPVIKAGKEETTCLLGVACSVKASVHVLVKGKKGESPGPEPAIMQKKSCLLDGEKRSGHGKARGDSREMEKLKRKSALSNMTLPLLNALWRRRKYSWWMEPSEEGTQHPM